MRKGVKTLLGAVIAVGSLVGCDKNPLADGRNEGVVFFTNPSFAIVKIDTVGIPVTARVMNRYNAPTGDAVTGTPCDSKLTVTKDTTRTEFESPERFIVKFVSPGKSCLIVSGGGITDSVDFAIGPEKLGIVANAALASGGSAPVDVNFLTSTGTVVTGSGLSASDVTFTSRNPSIVFYDPTTNTISGRAPGSTYVVTTLKPGRGVIVSDSVLVTVTAGAFTGVKPATIGSGSLVTLTAGAIPFDADTKATVNGQPVLVVTNNATTLSFVTSAISGTTADVVVSNLGPNQVSSIFSVPLTARPGATDDFTAPQALTLNTPVYGAVTEADIDDWYRVTLTAPGTLDVTVDWIAGGTSATNDVDAYVYTAAGTSAGTQSCGTSAKPEHCTFSLPAGTYIVNVEQYAIPAGFTSQPYKLTVK